MRTWIGILVLALFLAGMAWLSDVITPQGERTVYTVNCQGGEWQGQRCTGKLLPAERHRFRALRTHGEVLFWAVGLQGPSGRFSECDIQDGRNWSCKPSADASRTITLQIVHGRPVHDASGKVRSFRAVSKLRWLMASKGLPIGSEADL